MEYNFYSQPNKSIPYRPIQFPKIHFNITFLLSLDLRHGSSIVSYLTFLTSSMHATRPVHLIALHLIFGEIALIMCTKKDQRTSNTKICTCSTNNVRVPPYLTVLRFHLSPPLSRAEATIKQQACAKFNIKHHK
jgi:hypothetical protein